MSLRALVIILFFGLLASCADQARWQEEFDKGTAALKANDLRAANTHFGAALSAAESLGITGDRLAVTLGLYGGTLTDLGHPEQAEPLFRRSLSITEQLYGVDSLETAKILNDMGTILADLNKLGEAEQIHTRTLKIRQKQLEPNHPDIAASLINIADIRIAQNDYGQAEALLKQALPICQHGADPCASSILGNLGELYYRQRRFDDAITFMRRAVDLRRTQQSTNDPGYRVELYNLAATLFELGRANEATPFAKECLALTEAMLGPDHPDAVQLRRHLAAAK